MMIKHQHFINREAELEFLEREYKAQRPSFVIIYGRRRIGKTELIRVFCSNKPHIYFLADKSPPKLNIRRFLDSASEQLRVDLFKGVEAEDWETAVNLVLRLKESKEKLVLVFDEFPYLVEADRNTPYVFQRIWDLHLSRRHDVMLVLIGSSISMMESLLGYRSPLYGRRTGQWKLTEVPLRSLQEFLPRYEPDDLVRVYGAVGGVPLYLNLVDDNISFYKNIERLFLYKGGFLYEEAENLLRMELREPKNYKLILRAIAEGYTRYGEIASYTGLDKSAISRYLDVLETLDLVSYELPIFASPKAKRRRYYIKDNYFAFWFRYVDPHKPKIEEGRTREVINYIKKDYETYMGKIFEKLATKLIATTGTWDKVGKQWGKTKTETYEIDIVATNNKNNTLLLGEAKWSKLNTKEIKTIISNLKKKANHINWRHKDRKEVYAIIAREAEEKEAIQKEHKNVKIYTLTDILKQL
ncbi:MAG: ATP-binding protein [Thermoprotei archaeon]|nr:MAG: ATP-binding protein [Thermoprotei archaeon]